MRKSKLHKGFTHALTLKQIFSYGKFYNKEKLMHGFTLIETIIYIALFTILITGGFIAAFELIKGTDNLDTKLRIEQEANFTLKKLEWALTSLDISNPPTIGGSGCSQTLTTHKTNHIYSVITRINTIAEKKYIEMQIDGINFYPLTTENISVSCLKFTSISGTPSGITATVTINGTDFSITKYIRQ